MEKRTIEFVHKKKRLIITIGEAGKKPYGFIYPESTVYVDKEGTLRCLKCLGTVNRLWNRAGSGGDLYCQKCEKDLGKFTALGYGVEW